MTDQYGSQSRDTSGASGDQPKTRKGIDTTMQGTPPATETPAEHGGQMADGEQQAIQEQTAGVTTVNQEENDLLDKGHAGRGQKFGPASR